MFAEWVEKPHCLLQQRPNHHQNIQIPVYLEPATEMGWGAPKVKSRWTPGANDKGPAPSPSCTGGVARGGTKLLWMAHGCQKNWPGLEKELKGKKKTFSWKINLDPSLVGLNDLFPPENSAGVCALV